MTILEEDFSSILSTYDLGEYCGFKTFANGAGQTTILLETDKGKFVLRYYENRTKEHVLFEVQLCDFLRSRHYPVTAILTNRLGEALSTNKEKPYIIIEHIEGEHGKNPNDHFDIAEATEVVKAVAKLHSLTEDYRPGYFSNRKAFDVEYCWKEFQTRHAKLVRGEKGKWVKAELDKLEFPAAMSRGLCHADLNYGNFLFKNGKVVAVLDFDMSFHTFFIYDIASLIYWWAYPLKERLNTIAAAHIGLEYSKWRNLSDVEKAHTYDALKFISLLGISWSDECDYEQERERIELLDEMDRQEFSASIFCQ